MIAKTLWNVIGGVWLSSTLLLLDVEFKSHSDTKYMYMYFLITKNGVSQYGWWLWTLLVDLNTHTLVFIQNLHRAVMSNGQRCH